MEKQRTEKIPRPDVLLFALLLADELNKENWGDLDWELFYAMQTSNQDNCEDEMDIEKREETQCLYEVLTRTLERFKETNHESFKSS